MQLRSIVNISKLTGNDAQIDVRSDKVMREVSEQRLAYFSSR